MGLRILFVLVCFCGVFCQESTVTDDSTIAATHTSTLTTPQTTSLPPTTTTPPSTYHYYNITEKDVTCIMLDGDISFQVTYDIGGNATKTTKVKVPAPATNVTVKGSCKESDGSQFIQISWQVSNGSNSIKMTFEQSKDQRTWSISNFSTVIYMDEINFANATDTTKLLTSEVWLEMAPSEVPVNHSIKCYSNLTVKNISTTMDDLAYTYPIIMEVNTIQLQAFNKISSHDKFVDEIHCDADKIADIVPIAVGCALAVLVIVVLIAYIIGRRRRSASYQSV